MRAESASIHSSASVRGNSASGANTITAELSVIMTASRLTILASVLTFTFSRLASDERSVTCSFTFHSLVAPFAAITWKRTAASSSSNLTESIGSTTRAPSATLTATSAEMGNLCRP